MSDPKKEQWTGRLGVILAVAGSAVGLGNFLRFPGQAAQNGGGAFMIPYIIALLILGIPIGWAEWVMGRYGGKKGFHSTPAILGVIGRGRLARYLGIFGVLIPLAVYMYYVNIESWCLMYAFDYARGAVDLGANPAEYGTAAGEYFTNTTGSDQDGILAHGGLHESVVFWAITLGLNIFLVYRGLSKGIELFCTYAMPLMAICAIVVLIRVLTLGTPDPAHPDQNVIGGLGHMWNPKMEALRNPKTWLAAAGQIFFSLSVGFGVIVNYASYMKRKSDVVLSGLTASATNELFEVSFGGLITITAAFVFLGASGAVGGTFGLGFQTLPIVFEYMGPIGRWIGATWFFMLFLAAITSSLSMLQPVVAFLQESLGVGKGRAVTMMSVVACGGSAFVLWFSKGLVALDTIDFWVGTTLIFVLSTVQIIIFGWVFGIDRGFDEAHDGAAIRIPWLFRPIIKYVAPMFLLAIFFMFCWENLPGYLTNMSGVAIASLAVVGAVLLLLIVVLAIGEARWRREGRDLDGLHGPDPEEKTA